MRLLNRLLKAKGKEYLFIFIIIGVFVILRFVDLGVNGMHRDEIANGLDAYTLGINGTNLYGQRLPVLFKRRTY